jgi:polysaccharide export outer membrane protein
MSARFSSKLLPAWWAVLAFCVLCTGCHSCPVCPPVLDNPEIPRELAKVSLPTYVIEPPDILLINTLRVVPLPPYRIEPLDAIIIQASDVLPDEPINAIYSVQPEGTVNLGPSYGLVQVAGMTLEEAQTAITTQLKKLLKAPKVVVALSQFRGMQQIRGEHLVRPDGTISLGSYGSVYLAGLNLVQAKAAIEAHLAQYLLNPEISLDVSGYNSKVYYIIFDGAGYGQQIYRLPITGNETVLDAIGSINGLPAQASKKKVWIARPAPAEACHDQVLPVNWIAITECGSTATNYQVLPGDRIHVKGDSLICLDNWLAKIYSPIERTFGITILGSATVHSFRNNGTNNGLGGGF